MLERTTGKQDLGLEPEDPEVFFNDYKYSTAQR